MLIRGGCHCGNIRFDLDWQPDPAEIPARACDCTFCTAHAAVWTSNPSAALRVAIAEPALHGTYLFGTSTAEFHVCRRCGVVPVVTSVIDGRLFAVVNVNTFQNVDASMLRRSAVSFGAEETSSRLARRARGWIGDVVFAGVRG